MRVELRITPANQGSGAPATLPPAGAVPPGGVMGGVTVDPASCAGIKRKLEGQQQGLVQGR